MLSFTVPGKAKGKGRPRFTRTGRAYTPKSTKEYEMKIRECFSKKYPDFQPLDGAMAVFISVNIVPPKKVSRNAYAQLLRVGRPCKKPDVDNIAKAVLDALNGLSYVDDRQVTTLVISKKYADSEGLEVCIYTDEIYEG